MASFASRDLIRPRNRQHDHAGPAVHIGAILFERRPIRLPAIDIAGHFRFKRGVDELLDVAHGAEAAS